MTLAVTAQGSRHKEVCAWTFLAIFLHFFSLFLSLSLSLSSYFPFFCAFISDFCFGLASSLSQAGFLKKKKKKKQGQSRFSELNFSFFSAFESFWCPPSMFLRTDATSAQGHGNGTYKDINMNKIRE